MASFTAESPVPLGSRPRTISAALFALIISAAPAGSAYAGSTLTVGMTAGDIPVTTGNPDQGFEGYRFVGYNLYDALLLWDLSKSDKPSEPKPGLATSYEIDPNDHKHWIVHLAKVLPGTMGANSLPTMSSGIFRCAWTRARRTFRPSNSPIPGRFSAMSNR